MDNPFDMSFEEIMAQATANMEADRGEASSSPQTTAVPEKAASAQSATGEKTFLEMVEEAEKGKEAAAEKLPESGIPAGMSFEDLEKQAAPAMNPPVEEKPAENAPEGELSFEAMMAKAQAAAAAPTFDDMFNQAQGNMTQQPESSKAEKAAKEEPAAEEPVKEEHKAEPFDQPATGGQSFDDLLKQAELMADTSAKEPKQEEPVKEGPKQEEPVKEEPVKEEPKQEEPVKEEPKQEEPQGKEKGKKNKKSSEKKEVLPDVTSEYEVDLSGNGKPAGKGQDAEKPTEEISKPVSSEKMSLTLDNLFTEDEIDALRLMIHSFVRREFKRAMVGAMTDLLSEFKDE